VSNEPKQIHSADQPAADDNKSELPDAASFLDGLRLDHGPVPLLARFLLRADAYLRQQDIHLGFGSIATIAELNEEHFANWGRFAPQLDIRIATLTDADSYCLIGRNAQGDIVATQAGRIYDIGERSLQDIADDRSLYYGANPPPSDGLTCSISAPSARHIKGRFVYSGALWVRPDYRGLRLAALLPRMSRAYALGRWNTMYTFAFIGAAMASSPLLAMYGYRKVEPTYTFFENGTQIYTGSLMWMDAEELAQDLEAFISTGFEELDRSVGLGGGKNKNPAVR